MDDSVARHVVLTRGGCLIDVREVRLDLAQGLVGGLHVRRRLGILRCASRRVIPMPRQAVGLLPRCKFF